VPAVLNLLKGAGYDWDVLNDISGSFSIVGVLISGIALAGVVFTLLQQREELRSARLQVLRSQQADVYSMAINDVELLECINNEHVPAHDLKLKRQIIYVNLMVNYWLLGYELGHFSDQTVRGLAREVFTTLAGRTFAEHSHKRWIHSGAGRTAEVEFLRILHAEYASIRGDAGGPEEPLSPTPNLSPDGQPRSGAVDV